MGAAFLGVHVVGECEDVLGEDGVLILQRNLDDVAVDLPLHVHGLQVDDVAVGVEVAHEGLDSALEVERVRRIITLVEELDGDALVEERIAAEGVLDGVPGELDLREDLGVRPEPDVRAAAVGRADDSDWPIGNASCVRLAMGLAVEVDLDEQPLTQRVDDRQADAM